MGGGDDEPVGTGIVRHRQWARTRARSRLELQATAWDRRSACAQPKNIQNEPNHSQLAKSSGALRICALWRAARAGPKIRGMQNFFALYFNATTESRLRVCRV